MDGLDSAACLPLVHQAALLSPDEVTAPMSIEHGLVDGTTRLSFLSQSDMLHKILIPQAKKAISFVSKSSSGIGGDCSTLSLLHL